MDKFEIIKQTIEDLLKKMGFETEISIDTSDENNIMVSIYTNEAGFLIGQGGNTLKALQHISRVLVDKKISPPTPFVLDVNDYKKHRIQLLRELANSVADQVIKEKVPHMLSPMVSYERRIIHLTLANHSEVETESIGEEPERKVVIKPRK